jgi:hypothetical protein
MDGAAAPANGHLPADFFIAYVIPFTREERACVINYKKEFISETVER